MATIESISKDLTNLDRVITEAKKRKAQLEGRQEEILNQLTKTFSVSSITDAVSLRQDYDEEIKDLEETIQKKYGDLKQKFAW